VIGSGSCRTGRMDFTPEGPWGFQFIRCNSSSRFRKKLY
jgi:hypothetical protein